MNYDNNEYRYHLKRIGKVLILLGIIDACIFIYCKINSITYYSSFSLFGIIMGYQIYKGNLVAAMYVAWFSAFLLGAIVSSFLGIPIVYPWKVIMYYIDVYWVDVLSTFLITVLAMAFLYWVYYTLSRQSIKNALYDYSKKKYSFFDKPFYGMISGILVAVVLAYVVLSTQTDYLAKEIKEKAEVEVDGDYEFFVSGRSFGQFGEGFTVKARVIAYNETETIELSIKI